MTNADLARAVFASLILAGCLLYLVWWTLLPKMRRVEHVPDTFPEAWCEARFAPYDWADQDWTWDEEPAA